ncbi:TPA: hypothetical protein ACT5CK_002295 [Flavobacterium psychrophilum]|uniref:hypothetical protein n=1 Tax=Flavobacterium psychrophilum TaxID=96345 RepID=UPI00073F18ED|nr:hypothetical protein [Flavobacterium psychrophilum]GAQ50105.1 hypothetical protein FPK15_contig00102-0009 [Flavobacterium psychrophilum]GAW90626.1 hypothetical protein FPS14_contig00078-0001 [Flavobacterium psychrophilum]GEJ33910.1 hypothetical protein FPN185_contig00089-0001 [Flavobacterium psychrophilum]GEJ34124.1 hypothetical protein FPN181_contig00094-0001 [Flavobacterium psychrophilum]GEJ40652.1 hypothetical protein FPN187_contig00096-0001 [Flavobacterium psychrophilum]
MTPEEILRNSGTNNHELNLGATLLNLINMQCLNSIYLKSILKKQLETQELLKGNTEIDEIVLSKLENLEKKIFEVSSEMYHNTIQNVLK